METQTKLTPEEIEHIRLYLVLFQKAYLIQTGKKLTTVDQLVDLIKAGEFTFDDVFATHLEVCLDGIDEESEIYFDYNMEKFDRENYFPDRNKRIDDGAWIKIRTENGFEIHYAKKSHRKRRFEEEVCALQKKHMNSLNKSIKALTSITKEYKARSEKATAKEKELGIKTMELRIRDIINLQPYEIRINRTKTQVEYYLPYQYEIIKDIAEFSEAYVNEVPAVNIKSLYSSQNKDAVFYLQSRGISKKVAEMMAALKQTYFIVNMVEAIEIYNADLRRRIKFVAA